MKPTKPKTHKPSVRRGFTQEGLQTIEFVTPIDTIKIQMYGSMDLPPFTFEDITKTLAEIESHSREINKSNRTKEINHITYLSKWGSIYSEKTLQTLSEWPTLIARWKKEEPNFDELLWINGMMHEIAESALVAGMIYGRLNIREVETIAGIGINAQAGRSKGGRASKKNPIIAKLDATNRDWRKLPWKIALKLANAIWSSDESRGIPTTRVADESFKVLHWRERASQEKGSSNESTQVTAKQFRRRQVVARASKQFSGKASQNRHGRRAT